MTIIDVVQQALSQGEIGLRGFFVERLMLLINDRRMQHPEQEAEVAYWHAFKSILDDFQIACHAWAQERAMSKDEQAEFTLKIMRDTWRFDHLPKWMIVSVRTGIFIDFVTARIAMYPTVNEHQTGGEQLFSSFCIAVREVHAIQVFLPLNDEADIDNIAMHGFPSYWKSLSVTQRAAIAGDLRATLEAKFLQLLQDRYLLDTTLPADLFQSLLTRAYSFLLILFTRCDGSELQSWAHDAKTSHSVVADYLRSANPRHWAADNRSEIRWYYGDKYGGIVGGRAVLYNATVIKSVSGSLLHEVLAMELVKARTRIPVPRVLMTFSWNGDMFMVMSEVKGNPLGVSSRTLEKEVDHSSIVTQLQSFIEELQALGSDLQGAVHRIGAWPYGPLTNVVFEPPFYHPLCSLKEFHIYWRTRSREKTDGASNLIEFEPIILSHGDLNPSNILVRNGVIIGIVDWDTFGWYPSFWEPMMATRQFITPELDVDFQEKLVDLCGKGEIVTVYHKILERAFAR